MIILKTTSLKNSSLPPSKDLKKFYLTFSYAIFFFFDASFVTCMLYAYKVASSISLDLIYKRLVGKSETINQM